MGVAKMTTLYQIVKNWNLVTERVSIEFVWFDMSTAIGVGGCFECSESDVEFGMSSMWKTRRIVLTLANVSAQ